MPRVARTRPSSSRAGRRPSNGSTIAPMARKLARPISGSALWELRAAMSQNATPVASQKSVRRTRAPCRAGPRSSHRDLQERHQHSRNEEVERGGYVVTPEGIGAVEWQHEVRSKPEGGCTQG